MDKHIRLNITLPPYLADELTSVSNELNDKKSRIIAKALELYFDEMDVNIAEKRIAEIEDGLETTVPASDVWKELGL
mgnify:CR=1 FL=1